MTGNPGAGLIRGRFGASGLSVTPVGIGGSPLGGMESLYGHDTPDDDGIATAARAFTGPFNVLDTSNGYSGGRSEQRIGAALRQIGGLPEGFVLSTKVDADPVTRAFNRDRVLRSFEESMGRLGLERVDVLHLHDPESDITIDDAQGPHGAIAGLLELRDSGRVRAIGIAGGAATEMSRYVETGHFDILLTHNRFTLVDRTADDLIDLAARRDMGVINAAPFGGGVLARAPRTGDRYAYGLGTEQQVSAAGAIHDLLATVGIPVAAAALQFSVRDARIHTTLVGASNADRVDQIRRLLDVPIADDIWFELERMLPAREHWIGD